MQLSVFTRSLSLLSVVFALGYAALFFGLSSALWVTFWIVRRAQETPSSSMEDYSMSSVLSFRSEPTSMAGFQGDLAGNLQPPTND